jgi:ribosome-binding protein aMBF1 (putative translation factor)
VQDPHTITARKIVDLLQAERERIGWSQETLAVAARVSSSCVRHLERGRSTPTLITLLKLSEAMGVDLAVLLRRARKGQKGRR